MLLASALKGLYQPLFRCSAAVPLLTRLYLLLLRTWCKLACKCLTVHCITQQAASVNMLPSSRGPVCRLLQ